MSDSVFSCHDFNRDGTPDLVVVNNGINLFGTISILLADGSGGFHPPVSYSVRGPTPVWASVADFNRDDNPDIAISVTTTDSVAVLLGKGRRHLRCASGDSHWRWISRNRLRRF